jgi:alkanesulfonate monooxygenase
MLFAQPPERIRAMAGPLLAAGKSIGIRAAVVVRETREEALAAAREIVAQHARHAGAESRFITKSDSVSMNGAYAAAEDEWLTPWLWTGAVRVFGSSSLVILGSPDDVAEALFAYRNAGVTQFIFSGWPKTEEMRRFGRDVLPLVRQREAAVGSGACASF